MGVYVWYLTPGTFVQFWELAFPRLNTGIYSECVDVVPLITEKIVLFNLVDKVLVLTVLILGPASWQSSLL